MNSPKKQATNPEIWALEYKEVKNTHPRFEVSWATQSFYCKPFWVALLFLGFLRVLMVIKSMLFMIVRRWRIGFYGI